MDEKKKVYVFVLNMRGDPLMPTSPAKARRLLEAGKAKVKNIRPFTIQMTIPTGEARQNVNLEIKEGGKQISFLATAKEAQLEVSEKESAKEPTPEKSNKKPHPPYYKKRHIRYRKPRLNNRKSAKPKEALQNTNS